MKDLNAIDILLVEDDPQDVELALRALKIHHLANHVHVARDGAEALDFLFATGAYEGRNIASHPKVILLDLNLPKLSGIEVLRQLKANECTRTIPVVILTSSQEAPDLQECYRLGVNSYIVKPIGFDQFIKAVSELGVYWLLLNKSPF